MEKQKAKTGPKKKVGKKQRRKRKLILFIVEVLVIISILATLGYAKTTTAATKLNNSPGKPAGLTFIVKPV